MKKYFNLNFISGVVLAIFSISIFIFSFYAFKQTEKIIAFINLLLVSLSFALNSLCSFIYWEIDLKKNEFGF